MFNNIYFSENFTDNTLKPEVLRIVLDGKIIKTMEDFLEIIEKAFIFPNSCNGSLDVFMDYIRDFEWLHYDKIDLIIKNQKEFLKADYRYRNILLDLFREDILPYWEAEVLTDTVGGKCKEFCIYMIG